jgi:hypothetical protein
MISKGVEIAPGIARRVCARFDQLGRGRIVEENHHNKITHA